MRRVTNARVSGVRITAVVSSESAAAMTVPSRKTFRNSRRASPLAAWAARIAAHSKKPLFRMGGKQQQGHQKQQDIFTGSCHRPGGPRSNQARDQQHDGSANSPPGFIPAPWAEQHASESGGKH